MIIIYPRFITVLFCILPVLLTGCSKEEHDPHIPNTGLLGNQIFINEIQDIPDFVEFDHVEAEISGKWWKVIETVKGNYDGNTVVLELPQKINPELLSPSEWSNEEYGLGFWQANSTDPLAGVAELKDIIAYNGNQKVGRIFLTDWSGEGSTAGKAYIYYHYAEKEFSISGSNNSFTFSATFNPGWNAYANINNPVEGSKTTTTTDIPESLELYWHFESWVYQ